MANSKPRVTVLMPVYNSEKYLREAIDSILGQTYRDYEFIIINDGSTDGSVKIIQSYIDKRIKLINNGKNIGISATRNKGLELAVGEYTIVMDSDDISLPARIEKQVRFMDNHPEIGVSGTWVKFLDTSHHPWKSIVCKYPTKPRDIKARSLFNSIFAHPSVIIRRNFLEKFQLKYDPQYLVAHDYGLGQKCSSCFPLANIPEVLLVYRVHSKSITNSNENIEFEDVQRINRISIQNLGIGFSREELLIYRKYPIDFKPEFLIKFHSWLQKLQKANSIKQIYPEPEFSQALSEEWFCACYRSCMLGIGVWFLFWRLPLSRVSKFNAKQIVKFFLKCVIKKACINLTPSF
ncbi:MAG: glycosyltransferase family 2 protein [Candidatus Ratteibacteria bacterium]|jgi:glycosyltransferase involved in cell wall biosynthesis